jgi:ribosomal protein L17
MIRLYVPDPLSPGVELAPSADQARYLITVMRQGVGDAVLLFNGRDGEWRAVLSAISKRGCALRVETRTREQARAPDLELLIALVKRARLETIVEKATELGARRIRLVTTARTNADHTNVARLQAIARASARAGLRRAGDAGAPHPAGRHRGHQRPDPLAGGDRRLAAGPLSLGVAAPRCDRLDPSRLHCSSNRCPRRREIV